MAKAENLRRHRERRRAGKSLRRFVSDDIPYTDKLVADGLLQPHQTDDPEAVTRPHNS